MFQTKILIIIGPISDIIGVILISYELLWRPGKQFQLNMIKNKLKNSLDHRDSLIRGYKKIPRPPCDDEKIQPFIDKTNKNHLEVKEKLEQEKENIENEYRKGYYKNSLRGLFLIVIGFRPSITPLRVVHEQLGESI